eukprot:4233494-Prymnesium_polylepis.1
MPHLLRRGRDAQADSVRPQLLPLPRAAGAADSLRHLSSDAAVLPAAAEPRPVLAIRLPSVAFSPTSA